MYRWHTTNIQGPSIHSLTFPVLFQHSKKKPTVAEAMTNDNCIRDIMEDITAPLFSDYVLLWGLVNEANFDSSAQEEDEIFWIRMPDASYSAKSAYEMQFEGSFQSPFPTNVCRVWAPSRCKFFMWLMLQKRVWTAYRLQRRQWPNNYFCPLCYRNLETVHHLFVECPVVRQIWSEISVWTAKPQLHPLFWPPDQGIAGWFNELMNPFTPESAKAKGARSLAILGKEMQECLKARRKM
jgi:hypothetical protein